MSVNFKLLFGVILVYTSLLTPASLLSQTSPETTTIDSTLVDQPITIPVIDIIGQMERTSKELKQIEKKIEPKKSVVQIDSLIPIYEALLQEQQRYIENFITANPNRQKVNIQINKWSGYRDYLESWETSINVYEERNSILAEKIMSDEKIWELTYQNAKEENVPPQLLVDIKSIWEDVKGVYGKIKDENNYYLNLESKISDQIFIIDEVIEGLVALKNSDTYKLFYLRHLPIWKTSFKMEKKNDDEKAGTESISGNISGIFKFLKSSENDIYLFLIIIGFIIYGVLYIKKSFLKYNLKEQSIDLQNAKDLIVNKTAWVLVFITVLCASFFFINTPQLFNDCLVLLMIISAIPLVRPYLDKRFKNILYFVIFIFILDVGKNYFWFSSPLYRVYLLFQALLLTLILAYFTYPFLRTKELYKEGLGAFLVRLIPLVYTLVIISVISNVLGYSNLADLTIKICIQFSELTIIFFAILQIGQGTALGIVHNILIRENYIDSIRKSAIEKKVVQFLRISVAIFWIFYLLKMLDLLGPLTDLINGILSEPYKVGSVTFTLDMLLIFIGILAASFLITSFISFLLDGKEVNLKIVKLPKGIPAAISLVIRYFILAFGFVLALSSLGIDLSKFNLMAGALGLGIGFGLQNIISNFVSGIILVFERPILPGDTVEVNNLLGTVNKIGVRSSRISTYDGAEVVVPNNNLISNDLINWTLSDTIKRVEIIIGTSYDSDPNEILNVLTDVANGHKDVLKTPPARALFSEFGDSSLNFRLLFWVYYENGLQAKSDIAIAIYNRFKELNIEIPFPQRVVHFPHGPNDIRQSENEIIFPNDQTPEKDA